MYSTNVIRLIAIYLLYRVVIRSLNYWGQEIITMKLLFEYHLVATYDFIHRLKVSIIFYNAINSTTGKCCSVGLIKMVTL